MADCLGGCGAQVGEGHKCVACATKAAVEFARGRGVQIIEHDESVAERRARISRMSDEEYQRLAEEGPAAWQHKPESRKQPKRASSGQSGRRSRGRAP